MKIKNLLYTISAVLILSSCGTTFYQVYKVKPTNESVNKSNMLFFEDENCKITYNLWANGGNIGFNFYNKSNSKIYIKLNESSFILNGFAYDYYKNRIFTTSKSKSASASETATGAVTVTGINVYDNIQTNHVRNSRLRKINSSIRYDVSIKENSIVCVPPKTTKRIYEYTINDKLIRNCNLFKYPRKKEINTVSYKKDESPLVFSNRIAYEINGNSKEVVNEFYVSEITNYPAKEFFEYKYDEYCGQKMMFKTAYQKRYDTDKFYIKYFRGVEDRLEH